MKHKSLAVGIVFLFIIASVTPMVIGYKSEKDDSIESVDGPIDSAWPMKCHDLHHTGRSPYGTANISYSEKWSYEFDTWGDNSPAIGPNGIIYVGGGYGELTHYLFAFYPNGSLNWRYKTDGLILGSCPTIAEDGTIYIGSWDDFLHAVYPNGTQKWKFHTDSNIFSSPAIGNDGTIYIGTMSPGYEIIAINPDGTEKWRYPTGYVITSDPAIGDDGTIYIGSQDNYLYALYPNGTLRWRFSTGDDIQGPPSIAEDGTIYIGSHDGYLYAINPDGTEKWRTSISYGAQTNPSINSDGMIYISSASLLFAIYPENGTIKWTFNKGGGGYASSPAICADGIIYSGIERDDGTGGEIVAVNPDGTERWRIHLSNSWAKSSPAIGSDGTIYICSASFYDVNDFGHLHALGWVELEAEANGPYQGIINEPVQFIGSASGGNLPYSYHWNFGDDETSEEQNPTHEYDTAGNYTATLTVTDDNDTVAVDTTWALIRESNEPPEIPIIDGETEGQYGEPYDYAFVSIDPDEDDVLYYIDWGDDSNSGWIGPYSSGQEITVSHTWDEEDTYTIRVKAKDIFDAESNWGTLEVTMPVSQYAYSFPILQRIFERFPNAFPILRQIFEL